MSEQTTDTKIKLSGAIKKGIKRFPMQAIGAYFSNENGQQTADAMGSAVWGALGVQDESGVIDLANVYPELHKEHEPPKNSRDIIVNWTLQAEIEHRNNCGWSREKIADWLESLGY